MRTAMVPALDPMERAFRCGVDLSAINSGRVTKSLNARFLLEKNLVCQTRTATETTREIMDLSP